MKAIITFIFSLVILSSCGQKKIADDSTLLSIQIIDRNGFAETVSSKERLSRYQNTDFITPQPYQKVLRVFGKNQEGRSTSKVTSYHSNGHIWQYLEVVEGRAQGAYKEWHPNGHQKIEFSIIEGAPDLSESSLASWVFNGKNSIWDDKGNLMAEIFYEKGALHGDSLYYYPEGTLQKKVPYYQDVLQGSIIIYSPSGKILETISYVNDKPNGEAFAITEENTPIYKELFENGILLEGSYYIDNVVIASIHEGSGKKAEFEEGKLARLVEYKKGIPEGLVESFNSKGLLQSSYHQKEGKKQGEEKEYYLEEPFKEKILLTWQEDSLQGPVKTWFPNGIQESQKEMYQNKKNGISFAWYKNGNLMLSEEYENDVLVSGSYYKKGDKKPVSRVIKGKGTVTLYDAEGYFLKKIPYEKGVPLLEFDTSHER